MCVYVLGGGGGGGAGPLPLVHPCYILFDHHRLEAAILKLCCCLEYVRHN